MSTPIILLDVDGVLADFVGGICKLLGHHGFRRRPDQFFDLNMSKVVTPEEDLVIARYAHQMGFCSYLEWYSGAKDFVHELQELGEVYACTAPWEVNSWCGERIEWLRPLIPKQNVIFTHRKSLIRGDVIIEDSIAHAEASRCKHAIVLDRPWNRHVQSDREYEPFERMQSYTDIVNYIKRAYE